MRIWDLPPALLCRQHLLGEHRELHALWTILTTGKGAYANHPETRRWRGKLAALYTRHDALVAEMTRRGYNHRTPLDASLASGLTVQTEYVNSPAEQVAILRAKGCACDLAGNRLSATAKEPRRDITP
jgi:hypothetical protein